jgi:hypothetical protein
MKSINLSIESSFLNDLNIFSKKRGFSNVEEYMPNIVKKKYLEEELDFDFLLYPKFAPFYHYKFNNSAI